MIDQPRAIPPANDWSTVGRLPTDFSSWTTSDTEIAYGALKTKWLGLAKPDLAKDNAENYAVFSMCVKFPELDCVGGFTYAIKRGLEVPFEVSDRVKRRVRGRGMVREEVVFEDDEEEIWGAGKEGGV